MDITPADDSFHPPAVDDPMWTETTWWGFYAPHHPLGGMIYTVFRPNLGVASVVIQVWDAASVEPWRMPYARSQWHVTHPTEDLTHCVVGGLSLECIEPLTTYHLVYRDRDLATIDLTYTALEPPHGIGAGEGAGHFDQLCRATGAVEIAGVNIAIDAPVMRDRSWYVRKDDNSLRAGYTYGSFGEGGAHFLVQAFHSPDDGDDESTIFGGSVSRDGRSAKIVGGSRRVVARDRGHPSVIEIDAKDEDGNTLAIEGRIVCSGASQSTPGMFAWMSVVEWAMGGGRGFGEDHDVWSPDHLVRPPLGTRGK